MPRPIATHYRWPCVNVKTHHIVWPDGGTEAQRETAWDWTQETWWQDATEAAKEFGFRDLYAEGRSGGYAMPIISSQRGADLSDHRERRMFQRFAAWCNRSMEDLPAMYADNLAEAIEQTPDPMPAPPADECARFLAYCENRRDTAAASQAREFWSRLAGSVRKAATM